MPGAIRDGIKKRIRLITGEVWDGLRQIDPPDSASATSVKLEQLDLSMEDMRARLLEFAQRGMPEDFRSEAVATFDMLTASAWDDLKQVYRGRDIIRDMDKVSAARPSRVSA